MLSAARWFLGLGRSTEVWAEVLDFMAFLAEMPLLVWALGQLFAHCNGGFEGFQPPI